MEITHVFAAAPISEDGTCWVSSLPFSHHLAPIGNWDRNSVADRHMARHKEKDDEAGGEGLGILATRKRLWRDADGNIVNARRPLNTQDASKCRQLNRTDKTSSSRPSPSASTSASTSTTSAAASPATPPIPMSRAASASSTIVVDTGFSSGPGSNCGYAESPEEDVGRKFEDSMMRSGGGQDSWFDSINVSATHNHALPSPPISESSLHSHSSSSPADDDLGDLDALYEDAWPPLAANGLPALSTSSGSGSDTTSLSSAHSSYFGSAGWGSGAGAGAGSQQSQPFQTFMGAMAELPYDDMFKPEAGLYEWQTWSSQVLMSRCREEKCDALASAAGERKPEWGGGQQYLGQESFRKAFGLGLGTC